MSNKIDFVITWVDGNDPEWIEEKRNTLMKMGRDTGSLDNRSNRYRDMECLRYLFRGIERYAPWINRVFLVTSGQIPEWLNTENEKVVLVKHSDYMPAEVLPTFNSNAIESCMHLIPGLSEQFVYFNDDMFIINPTKPRDFFRNGKPCDTMSFHPIEPKFNDHRFYIKLCNDIEIINKHFDFREFRKKNLFKCISPKQGKHWLLTVAMLGLSSFRGFYTYHYPQAYLKSTFEALWALEGDTLKKTLSFQFRNNEESTNHWLFEYWQFATGNYVQRRSSFGTYENITSDAIRSKLFNRKYKLICVNDNGDDYDFDSAKAKLISLFEMKFPKRSSFEK